VHRSRMVAVAVGLVAAISFVACGGDNGGSGGGDSGGGTISIGGKDANDHGTEDISGKSSIEVEADNDGSDYYFDPTVITGTAGQKVTIELSNAGDTEHNFSIDSLGIDQDLEAGDKAEVQVTLPSSGTLTFYCKYHQGSGMLGEFKVA
jgi:plastocyanin